MDITLEEEIRRILIFTGKPINLEDIRTLVFNNRILIGCDDKRRQSIKTFARVMQRMPDVESVYINGRWKRKLKIKNIRETMDDYGLRVKKWVELFYYRLVLSSFLLGMRIIGLVKKLKT